MREIMRCTGGVGCFPDYNLDARLSQTPAYCRDQVGQRHYMKIERLDEAGKGISGSLMRKLD